MTENTMKVVERKRFPEEKKGRAEGDMSKGHGPLSAAGVRGSPCPFAFEFCGAPLFLLLLT